MEQGRDFDNVEMKKGEGGGAVMACCARNKGAKGDTSA